MPFSANASIISTDLDNMVRGLYRDNSDTALTGTLVETMLKSVSIAANSMGPTGGLHIIGTGIPTGVAGTKTIRLKFAGTNISVIAYAAGIVTVWHFDVWIFNTSNIAQRFVTRQTNDAGTALIPGYTTTAVDTTQNQTLSITGQLGNVGDTLTATMFDVLVVQIQ